MTDFFKCGITGWCLEILFTSFYSFRKRDFSLKGTTSIWMFPIYGSIAFLKPLFYSLRHAPVFLRGAIYSILIFLGEFLTGTILKNKNCCPWNYSNHKWHLDGIIRLDYFPVWFFAGLIFEQIVHKKTV